MEALPWMDWIEPALEPAALLTGIGYALLAVRRNRWAWVFGGFSSALLAWLAAGAALPLQAALQTLYVGMAVYGFVNWSADGHGDPLIHRWPFARHALAIGIIAAFALLVSRTPLASAGEWPELDAAVTGASLLATWMTARTVLENWLYWFFVNAASIVLYGSQGLPLVAGLYVVYFVIAIFGWRAWHLRWRGA